MANTKISALTNGNPALTGDLIPIARSGANNFITPNSILTAGVASSVVLAGATSGTTSITAPAVAGTNTNPVSFINAIQVPNLSSSVSAAYQIGVAGTGLGSPGAGQLALMVAGTTYLNINPTFGIEVNTPLVDYGTGTNGLTFASGLISLTGSGKPNFGFAAGKGQHFVNQAANSDMAGTCATSSSTTVSVTFTTAYTATPIVIVTPQTAGITSYYLSAVSTTGFTITVAPSGTYTFGYHVLGNPN